jgi:hypothetical protein
LTTSCWPYMHVVHPVWRFREGHAMAASVEVELETLVDQAFAIQSIGEPRAPKQVDGSLLQQARLHPLLDVLAAPALEDDGVDALPRQEMREEEDARARSDDRRLRAHPPHRDCRVRADGPLRKPRVSSRAARRPPRAPA